MRWGKPWPGNKGLCLFCFNHYVPDTVHGSCLAGGRCPWGLMPFKCLSHAHTILAGLVLSWKEDKGETLTPPGSSYWGAVSSGAFATHQRVTLARVPQLLPQHLLLAEGP